MKPPSRKLVRPPIRTRREDADRVGLARIYAEFDAGTGEHVTFDLKIAVHRRSARGLPRVVRKLEAPSAELWDEQSPDQQQDDPEGVYMTSLFSEEPVWVPRPKRGWRKFGRRR
jgi:hypothetical protein